MTGLLEKVRVVTFAGHVLLLFFFSKSEAHLLQSHRNIKS